MMRYHNMTQGDTVAAYIEMKIQNLKFSTKQIEIACLKINQLAVKETNIEQMLYN
ncbi:hypothetical protein Tsp_06693 [Trichinella spiralis]|uniref:hypothetical protein n=1 Tax=Trichinella spiralis TaxID=6334 RepID=UPI0001EFBFE9|nr:hypothetical protein Tsp_06693 [Trichinella spiralis]